MPRDLLRGEGADIVSEAVGTMTRLASHSSGSYADYTSFASVRVISPSRRNSNVP